MLKEKEEIEKKYLGETFTFAKKIADIDKRIETKCLFAASLAKRRAEIVALNFVNLFFEKFLRNSEVLFDEQNFKLIISAVQMFDENKQRAVFKQAFLKKTTNIF
ncbi:hypothetical protein [Alphaproteobacteria bacterium endosymbiont of Tiliacea citrago]|uniref:hypothetical protein n=1 Tax=Alphaproteobacteria bacterium endosymbiont of Tiliacea citrago TaxID=3077944 RepID=UPI00313EA449